MLNYLKQTYYNYKADKRLLTDYTLQKSNNTSSLVNHYNWWQLTTHDGIWLSRLIQSLPEFQHSNKSLSLLSVFGNRQIAKYIDTDIKIFCTGENVKKQAYSMYADHMLNDKTIDLALGFEYFECKRYLRFPLWIMYAFEPTFDEQAIRQRCAELRYPRIQEKQQFAALVASHDDELHLRSTLYDALSAIGSVACPGKFHHNDDSLKTGFGDDKIAYLRQFAFNICPENANTMGYVTEKLFEAIIAGCVPVYWGSYNNPEPGILNPDSIIFWNIQRDNTSSIQLLDDLYHSPSCYNEFAHQPRLLPHAEEYILTMMSQLHAQLIELLR